MNQIIKHKNDWYLKTETGYKKIIATTDSSLLLPLITFKEWDGKPRNLPQPSPEFIQKYIKAYNERNPITEVMVEYEDNHTINRNCHNCGYYRHSKAWGEYLCRNEYKSFSSCDRSVLYWTPSDDVVYQPKVNKDNTITIRRVKDSWTREEVETLLQGFKSSVIRDHHAQITNVDVKNWTKENL